MDNLDFLKIIGKVKFTTYDAVSGEILDVYTDNNVITTSGKQSLLQGFVSKNTNLHTIGTIFVGDDYGSGTLLAPESPTTSYTSASQSVKYEVPSNLVTFTAPATLSMKFMTTIVGSAVMANYPSLPNIVITSATLRNENNVSVAAKRFPARTISSLTNMDIEWTLEFQ